jgi:uncharacterized damage-inducible protein DinB
MYTKISDFEQTWTLESANTQKLFDVLTDASLKQEVTSDGRTLGRLAWHITTTVHEMMSRTGLVFQGAESDEVPASAAQIAESYRQSSAALLEAIRTQWTDAKLAELSDMYGQQWPNGLTLNILISHEIHHRGQLTVLMRQAGLKVPGIYGPAKEEWSSMGMEPPAV